ncbi:MAG: hypothetical protein ABI806_19480 [Candidatus Solibacter sp.]
MPQPQDLTASLAQALSKLATQVPAAEQRLEEDHERRLTEFAKVLKLAEGTGWEDLARCLTPAPVVIQQSEIELGFVLSHTESHGWSLNVPNYAWTTRYPLEDVKRQSIRITVQRIPFVPGREIPDMSPS